MGKPSPITMQVALEVMGLEAAECIQIGDRLETDIRMGLEAGMSTALVMTGVTDAKTMEASPYRPDHVFDSIANLGDIPGTIPLNCIELPAISIMFGLLRMIETDKHHDRGGTDMMGCKINKRFIAVLSVFMAFSVASCASTGKKVNLKALQNWTKVALIEVMITPPESPDYLTLQSAIYGSGINKLSPDITNLHQERIDKMAETIGEQLGENLGFSVLHGRQLLKHDVFKNIEDAGIKTYPTTLKNESFKSLVIPSRGYNFFNFSESDKDPYSLFNGESNPFLEQHANSIAALCTVLGVDSVAVATFTVETTAVNFFAQGSKVLVVKLTFFDRSGKVFYYNIAWTDGENSPGGNLEAYKNVLDKYPDVIKTLKTLMVD